MRKKLGLKFPVLRDLDNALAAKFSLVFTLPKALREIYLSFGIDLERYNGNDSWSLPMPARYIISPDGEVYDADVNVDYTVRPEPEETMEKLHALTV